MPDIRPLSVDSAILETRMELRIYHPPGFDPARRYPIIYCAMGHLFLDRVGLPEWLDQQIAAGALPPCLLAGSDGPDLDRWWNPGTAGFERFQRFLLTEAIPAVESAFPVGGAPELRHLAGFSAGSLVLISTGLRHGQQFGRVAALSPGWLEWQEDRTIAPASYVQAPIDDAAQASAPFPAYWFGWGDADDPWESRSRVNGAAVIAALQARGVEVTRALVPGGHGLTLLQDLYPAAFRFLLQPQA